MALSEDVLSAWMRANFTISNRRFTNEMPYNEAAVCKILWEAQQEITAKALCEQMRVLKSQMNAILSAMRSKGIIEKQRASHDKRKVYIRLTAAGRQAFLAEHRKNIALIERLIADVGPERARCTAEVLNQASDLFGKTKE